MQKYWLLSYCFLLAFASLGQGRDTVLAIHKLFKQQRPKGYEAATAGAEPLIQSGGPVTDRIVVATASGASYALVGALQNQRFSVEREALILQQYAQGLPIPADIRRRLQGTLFKRTARDVNNGF